MDIVSWVVADKNRWDKRLASMVYPATGSVLLIVFLVVLTYAL